MRSYIQYKNRAIELRRQGKTYTEIQEMLSIKIPASTLSTWLRAISFSREELANIQRRGAERIRQGKINALATIKLKREKYFEKIYWQLASLGKLLQYKDIAKVALMMLYWCEGFKHRRSSLCFGNSDPNLIGLFLRLLRCCYVIDERKFRCTVRCRADQDPEFLESYWAKATNIPLSQFYSTKIDKRTIGKPSKKTDYKGVCRIDYFSAKIYHELMMAEKIFNEKGR